MKAGSTVYIVTRLHNTPFASTIPKSIPILNFINTRARSPTIVVKLLLNMDDEADFRASDIARSISFSSTSTCLYLFIRMME